MRYRVGFGDFRWFWGYFGGFWVDLGVFGLFIWGLGVGLPMRYRVGFGDLGWISGILGGLGLIWELV